jgi:hypothetical protein
MKLTRKNITTILSTFPAFRQAGKTSFVASHGGRDVIGVGLSPEGEWVIGTPCDFFGWAFSIATYASATEALKVAQERLETIQRGYSLCKW